MLSEATRWQRRFPYRVLEDAHVAASSEYDDIAVAPQAGRVTHPEEDAGVGAVSGSLQRGMLRGAARRNQPGLVLVWVPHLAPASLSGVEPPGVTWQEAEQLHVTFTLSLNSDGGHLFPKPQLYFRLGPLLKKKKKGFDI